MGVGTFERDLRQARIAFVGAVRRLEAAMGRFEEAEVPLWPEQDGSVPEWSPAQTAVMKAAADAWVDVVRRRQDYDSAARTATQPSAWPYASPDGAPSPEWSMAVPISSAQPRLH